MKKAFNFRSAIVCVLVLIMCLTAFVACDKDKDGQDDLSGLAKAKDYVKQLYINNNEETAADYTVVSKVNIAGTIYNVSWTVAITTEGAAADSVKVVAGESNVTIDVIDMAESEIKYVLTATITDAKGNTETVSFNRKVPKFHVATWAEYAAAEDGKLLVVDGIVTMFNSKGNGDKYNSMYIQDADGAYYAYSMDEDPKDKNIAVGMKVRLTGTKKNYNGTYELEKVLIKEVLDTNVQVVAPINIDELLANVTSAKDKKLTNLQGSIVTLSGAILVEVDDSQKYCYFTVGGIKTYIRPSKSAGFLSDEEITAFMKAFKENKAHTATITGQALVYNNAFYMQPISKDAVVYGAVADLTPAEQVKFVKDNANALSNVTYSGYSVTLPAASDIFPDVKIAWKVDNTEICNIVDGKATFTYDYATEGRKVKLTATYTHATDATVAPLTNEYELELLIPQDATVEEFLAKDEDGKVYIITGYIVADGSNSKGSFVVADATGAVFSYNKADVELGDKVKVYGTRSSNSGVPQIGTINVVKVDAEGESYTYPEPAVIDGTTFDLSTLTSTSIAAYTGKYTKVTGLTFYKDASGYSCAGLLKDGKTEGSTAADDYTQVLSLYSASNAIPADWAGKPVVVYGYVRGFSANKYLTIQVAKVEIGYDDATKVAQAKEELTLDVTSTGTDFTLTTTGIYGTTISWTSSNTAVVSIEGGNATVDNTTIAEDTVVTLTATIRSNETTDTKTFDVTITKVVKNYTVTIVAPTEGGTLVVQANTENVVSGASLTENTVLTFVATPAQGYKLVAIKVNGVAVSETTLALTENVEVTAEFAEMYPEMTIAQFKNSDTATGAGAKLTGVVTSIDKKAVYIQDADGNAVYVFFGYKAPYSDTLATMVVGKQYTFTGTKDVYNDLVQLKEPVVIGEAIDPEKMPTPKVLDENAYKNLQKSNSAEYVTINEIVVSGGKWMLGETEIAHYEGNAPSANTTALNARVALLEDGVKFNLVGVNVTLNNKGALQIAVHSADQVVIDWVPVAAVDLKEIGVNGTAKITVTANPAVTTDVKATFVTENDQIATVDENGVVTGVAVGTVGINVTANGHTVKVEITVVAVAEEFTVNYTKTVDGANGSIASVMAGETAVEPGTKVLKGTKVTVTVTPAEGYQLASYTLNAGDAVAANGETSFDVTVTEDVTIAVTFEVKPAEPVLVATFALGKNGDASHADGSSQATYTETVGEYTLDIVSGTKMYTGARDATGNSCLKLGTGSAAASFTINVPTGVKKVVVYIAGYKTNVGAYTINGGAVAKTTKLSNNGEYDAVEIDVPADGKIVIATTSAGYRAMINTIEFYA